MTIGSEVLRITTQRKGVSLDRLISRCTSQAGTWRKSPARAVRRILPSLAPLNIRFAFQHICDCFLRPVMVDPRLCVRFDKKNSAPERRVDAQFGRHCREPLRTRRLRGSLTELVGVDDTYGKRIALAHAQFDVMKRGRLQPVSLVEQASARGGFGYPKVNPHRLKPVPL